MPTPPTTPDDAAFWAALGLELQSAVQEGEAADQDPQPDVSDHVFHDGPVDLDAPLDPEALPAWGEVFTW